MKHAIFALTAFVLVSALASTVRLTAVQGTTTTGCGLPVPAYCDPMNVAHSDGERSGQMDHSTWSVSRLNQANNTTQGALDFFQSGTVAACGETFSDFQPDSDVSMCGGGQESQLDDGGNFAIWSAYVRQPFDWAGRVGRLTFDVDAHTHGGHTDWTEVLVTNLPIPAPSDCNPDLATPGTCVHPQFGFDFMLSNSCTTSSGASGASLEHVYAYANYQLIDPAGNLSPAGDPCIPTLAGSRNHFEIDIDGTTNNLTLWASDPGGANFRLYDSGNVGNLGFTRGHVAINHVSYNSPKEGFPATSAYSWANVGFDGPVLPIDFAWDLPDDLSSAAAPNPSGNGTWNAGENLGYQAEADGTHHLCANPSTNWCRGDLLKFTSPLLPSGTAYQKAFITMNVALEGGKPGALIWTLDGTSSTYTIDGTDGYNPSNGATSWVGIAIPVPPSSVSAGTNTLAFSVPSGVETVDMANIGLKMVPLSSTSGGATPASTPTPGPTATSVPTSPPAGTKTPQPTATPTVTATSTAATIVRPVPVGPATVVPLTTPTATAGVTKAPLRTPSPAPTTPTAIPTKTGSAQHNW